MRQFDRELVSGSIVRSVWKIAWPVVLLNLINGSHSLIDHALVGHYVEAEHNAANSAIGESWQLFLVIVVFIASVFHGMNVLISRYAGRQDRDMVSHVFFQALLASAFILIGILAPLGYFLSPLLLQAMNTLPEVLPHALPYLRLMFTFGAPLFMMFMLTGALQAMGDTKTPLALGVLAAILHVAASATFITGAGPAPQLGAAGAAIGSIFATSITTSIALYLVFSGRTLILPRKVLDIRPDFEVLGTIVRIGVPTGVQGVLLNVGGLMLIRFINGLENAAAALAAYTICYTQLFNLISWTSFGLRAAAATLMGQNLGAGQPERAGAAVGMTARFAAVWAIGIGLLYWYLPSHLLGIIGVADGEAHMLGVQFLKYLSFSGVVLAITLVYTGGLQGAGDTTTPMWIALATQIFLLLGICYAAQLLGLLSAQVVWISILVSHTARLFLTYGVFTRGRWADIKIEVRSPA